MPLSNYKGPGLDGAPIPGRAATPPPPPPAARPPAPAAAPVAASPLSPLDALPVSAPELPREFQGIVVNITDTGRPGVQAQGHGPTLDDALRAAMLEYEAIQPVVPLGFTDGTPLAGYARQVLAEALDTYEDYIGANADPQLKLIIGRLKGAIGEESGS